MRNLYTNPQMGVQNVHNVVELVSKGTFYKATTRRFKQGFHQIKST